MPLASTIWSVTCGSGVLIWYEDNYYSKSPRIDPEGPKEKTNSRVIRGGILGQQRPVSKSLPRGRESGRRFAEAYKDSAACAKTERPRKSSPPAPAAETPAGSSERRGARTRLNAVIDENYRTASPSAIASTSARRPDSRQRDSCLQTRHHPLQPEPQSLVYDCLKRCFLVRFPKDRQTETRHLGRCCQVELGINVQGPANLGRRGTLVETFHRRQLNSRVNPPSRQTHHSPSFAGF